MRLDPKYFNLFIVILAFLTVLVIIFGTIRYTQNQARDFRQAVSDVPLDTLSFQTYQYEAETIRLSDFRDSPVIIQFWSTWSGKSLAVNSFLEDYIRDHPDLIVLAAAIRDDETLINNHINSEKRGFIYVEGTPFFQELLVPGVPSQILIGPDGKLFDTQVGDDVFSLDDKLNRLMNE
ncbi:TlpA family protein disulfide reductase [Rhodohalobacter halophilus]|uniref:TlpA family protein disulfide reductase n=1 Tax=Rhodohalobacter halophilus TaxID=1812810 RepID=UPI00083F7359|nr:hypothetical protein [Rhodohalobacter halophilus]